MFGKYWKSAIAFLVPFVTLIPLVAANEGVQAALPGVSSWLLAVGLPILTGAIAFLKRNQMTADQLDEAYRNGEITLHDLQDLQDLIARHGAPPPQVP